MSCAAVVAALAVSDGGLSRAGILGLTGDVAGAAATLTGQDRKSVV